MNRPEKTEYAEYYETYVSLVPEKEILPALENQIAEIKDFFAAVSEEKGSFAYAEGKWTVKELLGHLIDAERIFAYRALRFSRNDKTPLASFEEKSYIENSSFDNRRIADLVEELTLVRRANNIFFKTLPREAWGLTGIASDNNVSVNALAYIMVGHVRHHLNILNTRYLNQN